MRIAVMGAGAVGCYYGGLLARAGHEVTLVGRPVHVDAVCRDGLLLETASWQARIPMAATTGVDGVRGAELVLFCVKSADTERTGREIAPHLNADAVVLCLQNGVDNAQRLQAVLQQRVEPVAVYVASEMAGPGHVRHHGGGQLVVARSAMTPQTVAQFEQAGVPMRVSDNVPGELWTKLIVNCSYNALSAITQLPYGRLVQGAGILDVIHDVVDECRAVARADGIAVPHDIHEIVQRISVTLATQRSSTAHDLARGKPTEIDYLNGYVVRRGQASGTPTPVNRTLHALVKVLEQRDEAPRASA